MKTRNFIFSFVSGSIGGLFTFAFIWFFYDGVLSSTVQIANGSSDYHAPLPVDSNIAHNAVYSPSRALLTDEGLETDMVDAAHKTVDAVVHVKTAYMQQYGYGNPFLEYFFGNGSNRYAQPILSSGSGVIISKDGYIITNNHVIDKAQQIKVVLNDKREYDAEIIGADVSTDIALLKISETNLPFIEPGNSDHVKVGEWVMAVGNPFNLTSTVTAGIVSAKARNINLFRENYGIESFIQTDAAVNPGNSGGALVNRKGELIGINTAIASKTGSFAGYSFAVPVNIALKVVEDFIEFGQIQRAVMGVAIRDLTGEVAKEKGINTLKGVLIDNVTSNGSADKAGIKSNDVITRLGSVDIDNVAQLQEQLSKFRPGDKILVAILRNKKEQIIEVVLQNRMGNTEIVTQDSQIIALGARFKRLDDREKRKLGINYGLKIVELSPGKLMNAGVHEGFTILAMNGMKINSETDIQAALQRTEGGVMVEGIYPNGMKAYYAFGM